jgi:hypothetical protein
MDYWGNFQANLLNGTDATFYAPLPRHDKPIHIFLPDVCRSFRLEYSKNQRVSGVKTFEFRLPLKILHNNSLEYQGFCNSNNTCLTEGLLNVSKCFGGISFFMSQPHFLNAKYSNFTSAIQGLNTDMNLHDTVLNFDQVFD